MLEALPSEEKADLTAEIQDEAAEPVPRKLSVMRIVQLSLRYWLHSEFDLIL